MKNDMIRIYEISDDERRSLNRDHLMTVKLEPFDMYNVHYSLWYENLCFLPSALCGTQGIYILLGESGFFDGKAKSRQSVTK
jgi:hypothetical protein